MYLPQLVMDVKTVKPIIAGLHLSNFSSSRIFDIQRWTAQRLLPRIAASLKKSNDRKSNDCHQIMNGFDDEVGIGARKRSCRTVVF
jgi:hypothetical protein